MTKNRQPKTRPAYLISLDGNADYETNIEDEYLIFDNLDQIAEYCNVNYINPEIVSIHSIEVEA